MFDTLIAFRNKLPLGSIDRLLVSMYTMILPARDDYYATEIIRGDEVPTQPNFIRILEDGKMILTLNDFKTNKIYNQLITVLPPQLIIEINSSLEKQPRSFLFVNKFGKPFTRISFKNWARRVLANAFQSGDFLISFFRLYFAFHYVNYSDISKITEDKIKKLSDKMGDCPELFKAMAARNNRFNNVISSSTNNKDDSDKDDKKE